MRLKYNKSDAKQQYFEIRNSLNQSNKLKNSYTELKVIICSDKEEDFIILKSSSANYGIRLAARKKHQVFWVMQYNENYQDLYEYIFFKIKQLAINDDININQILTSWLRGLWSI